MFFPFLGFASGLTAPKVNLLLQTRYDSGDLLYENGTFKERGDLYIRRLRLLIKQPLTRRVDLEFNIAADRWFQDYKNGVKKSATEKVVFRKALIRFRLKPWFVVSFGRDKKPFSRAGLNSSKNLLMVDKPAVFLKTMNWLGDYYATQLEISGNLYGGKLKYALATFYPYKLHYYNDLKAEQIHVRRYFFDNAVFRISLSPISGWVERKINNTTFGEKAFSVGFSYGYAGGFNALLEGVWNRVVAHLLSGDLFLRTPKVLGGKWVTLAEYVKGTYNLSRLTDRSTEGVYLQVGYRPFAFKKFPVEITARVESLSFHPGGKGEKIYSGGFNLYSPDRRVKFTYNLSAVDYEKIFSGKRAWVNSLQLQIVF